MTEWKSIYILFLTNIYIFSELIVIRDLPITTTKKAKGRAWC